MKQTFNEIIEQIKNGKIKFPYSDTLFEEYSPENIDQLIYIAAYNYIVDLVESYNSYVNDCSFRTEKSDKPIKKLINENIKSTGVYFNIEAPNDSWLYVEVDFPEYNEETDFKEYINKLFALIDDRSVERCLEFSADEEFNELWNRNSQYSARDFLEFLDSDEAFFREFADKVKGERIYDRLYRR